MWKTKTCNSVGHNKSIYWAHQNLQASRNEGLCCTDAMYPALCLSFINHCFQVSKFSVINELSQDHKSENAQVLLSNIEDCRTVSLLNLSHMLTLYVVLELLFWSAVRFVSSLHVKIPWGTFIKIWTKVMQSSMGSTWALQCLSQRHINKECRNWLCIKQITLPWGKCKIGEIISGSLVYMLTVTRVLK